MILDRYTDILSRVKDGKVAKSDKKISDIEMGLIKQTAYLLTLNKDPAFIMKNYNNSEFADNISNTIFPIILFLVISLLLTGAYFYHQQAKENINIFDKRSIVFSEVSYNRYVIYKNKFSVQDKHFLKQAVFYMNGKAEISIDPQSLEIEKMVSESTSR